MFSALQTTTMEKKNLYAEFFVDAQVLIGSTYFEAIAGVML
jgi:hypothetical protein